MQTECWLFCRNPEILDELVIDDNTKEILAENIRRRLTPQAVKIRAGKHILFFHFCVCYIGAKVTKVSIVV